MSTEPEHPTTLASSQSCDVSSEPALEPSPEGTPVVVLSNNDGCVIAMSLEAKALNIPMGTPWFKLKSFAKANWIVVTRR